MTLVSTIGFSYTHHLVALSRTHFRHFRFQNGGHQTNKIGNRGGGVRSRIEYHMGHMAVTGEHNLYLLVIIPLPCHGLLVAILFVK